MWEGEGDNENSSLHRASRSPAVLRNVKLNSPIFIFPSWLKPCGVGGVWGRATLSPPSASSSKL